MAVNLLLSLFRRRPVPPRAPRVEPVAPDPEVLEAIAAHNSAVLDVDLRDADEGATHATIGPFVIPDRAQVAGAVRGVARVGGPQARPGSDADRLGRLAVGCGCLRVRWCWRGP